MDLGEVVELEEVGLMELAWSEDVGDNDSGVSQGRNIAAKLSGLGSPGNPGMGGSRGTPLTPGRSLSGVKS